MSIAMRIGGSPTVRMHPGPMAARRRSRPRGRPTGPAGRSAWLDVDWREHQRWVRSTAAPVNVDRPRRPGASRSSSSTASSGSWQNWLENIPVFARDAPRASRSTCRASAHSRDARARRSRSPATARLVDALLDELGVDARRVVGNSMGGFIGAELAIQFPQRVERLVLVARGRPDDRAPAQRARAGRAAPARARPGRRTAAGSRRAPSRSRAGRGCAAALLQLVAAHPDRLPAPLVAEQIARLGQARLHRRARRADRLPDPRPAARDRLPDADRVGRGGPPGPGPRRRRASSELIPDSRKVVFAGHRPRGDVRAPGGVQRAARGVPGGRPRRARSRRRRRRRPRGPSRPRWRRPPTPPAPRPAADARPLAPAGELRPAACGRRRSDQRDRALGRAAHEARVLRQHAGDVGVGRRPVGRDALGDLVVGRARRPAAGRRRRW